MKGANINTFVIDASYVLNYIMPDEGDEVDPSLFERYKAKEVMLITSPMLSFEVTNALKSAVKSKRISIKKADILLKGFLHLRITQEEVDFAKTLIVAHKNDLSIYDASYIFLAQSRNASLLSFDKKMQKVSKQ